MSSLYPLIAVVGATGSGKSELALRLAGEFGGEIVNCDSVQVTRGLDVGSAKTPVGERRGIPHHLLDVVAAGEELTAGDYARRAAAVLEEIRGRGRLPVIVGGTGFYLRALLDGLPPAAGRNAALRRRLTEVAARRPGALWRFLKTRDAAAAGRIHANDLQKLMRAIELAGQAAAPRRALEGFRALKIGLQPERAALYETLNRRTERMFEMGLLEETRGLLAGGVSPQAKAFEALGYRQALRVLTENAPLAEAIADCQRQTRRYAKRQMTWFRREDDVRWLEGFGSEARVQEEAAALVRDFLG